LTWKGAALDHPAVPSSRHCHDQRPSTSPAQPSSALRVAAVVQTPDGGFVCVEHPMSAVAAKSAKSKARMRVGLPQPVTGGDPIGLHNPEAPVG
jgi:hypothetical protein